MTRNEAVAERLLAAWHKDAPLLDQLPPELAPATVEDAREIQDLLLATIGPIGGYKVGASGPTAPIGFAPLPASGILPNATTLVGWHQRWVEAEIAVRLAYDLPRRRAPYTDAEILAAIASIHPVIEVLNSRFRDPAATDALSLSADLIMHGALIVGAPIPMPDMTRETVTVLIDGVEVSHGKGHPAVDMPRLLRLLANETGIKAGHIVTTGSWNPITIPPAHSSVTVRFAHAGDVTVSFRE